MAATKYFAKLKPNAPPVELSVERLNDGRYAVTLNGKRHEIDALMLAHGAVSMLIDGESHSVEFEERNDLVSVLLETQVNQIDIVDERRARLREATKAFSAEGKQQITAPMPGKIVKVLVKLGEAVKEGQGLVVIEAMKMENELKSPKAGKVVELTAKEGTAVENGAKLAAVE
jgi:biotin carboxyl carrier protein